MEMDMYLDEKAIAYINHYAEQLDSKLYSELKLIDANYRAIGKFGSEKHQNERHYLIKSRHFKVLEIEARFLDTQRNSRLNEIGHIDKGKLILNQKNGHTIYWTNSLKKFEATFKPRTNPYKLLNFMGRQPDKMSTAKELVEVLNAQRENANSIDDRRVRDTVQTVRKKLGLIQNSQDDFFIVENGFGLKCDVELKS